jgi:hypothetical protein
MPGAPVGQLILQVAPFFLFASLGGFEIEAQQSHDRTTYKPITLGIIFGM